MEALAQSAVEEALQPRLEALPALAGELRGCAAALQGLEGLVAGAVDDALQKPRLEAPPCKIK